MKKIFHLLLLTTAFPLLANATAYSHTGTINKIGAIESRDDGDFLFMNGFTSAGNCPKSSNGFVVLRFRSGESGQRSYSMALAAKMADRPVNVSLDDAIKNGNGYCFLHAISIE